VVVCLAHEPQPQAAHRERAEALAGGAAELDADRAGGQAVRAVAAGDLARQPRAHRALVVADRVAERYRLAPLQRRRRIADELVVERLVAGAVVALLGVLQRPRA